MHTGHEWIDEGIGLYWLERRASLPHWHEAEMVVLEDVIADRRVQRILDLGTGDGYMLSVLRSVCPHAEGIGLDISPSLLKAGRHRFDGDSRVQFMEYDMACSLPSSMGEFDVVISALAVHHLPDSRKRALYAEVRKLLAPGGIFCNVDVVTSPTEELQRRAEILFSFGPDDQHVSDQPAPLGSHLTWLDEAGYTNVDCYWKWRKLTVLAGERPVTHS